MGTWFYKSIIDWLLTCVVLNKARRKKARWDGVFTRRSRYDTLIKNYEVKTFFETFFLHG